VNVAFDPAFSSSTTTYSGTLAPGDGYGACSNTYCHSNGTSVATGSIPSNGALQWGSGSLSCSACHSYPPDYANGSPKANTHAKHDEYTCNNCHYTTTNNGTSISSKTTHVNKLYTVDPGAGRTLSYTYASSGGTCSNISCHFGGTATWGGTIACGGCHAATAETLTTGSHRTHLSSSVSRGPNSASTIVTCDTCHGTGASAGTHSGHANGTVSFADGSVLAGTTACDTCHSPGGDYNGVADAVIGAKTLWSQGVYTGNSLLSGKEKWCAGCHDMSPSVIASVSAPNVIGDENGVYAYGTGWGYYKTGHGLISGTYPASGAPAAKKECSGCHDFSKIHIDGEHRTYSASSDNYQAGYRLQYNMDIPRTDVGEPVSDFAVCFSCHNSDPYLNSANFTTNFREGATGNSHYLHLQSPATGQFAGSGWWDSDWDGSTGDSKISCPACHNVHGSPLPRMMQHGELISTPGTSDKVPALNFKYTPSSSYPILMESTGGELDPPVQGGGTIGNTGVCSMCHSNQEGYTRAPNDTYPPQITGVYGTVGGNILMVHFSKGVYTNTGASGALFSGDFTFTDSDNGRIVSGVTHTAGDDFALLTLSAALDASNDIEVDTLAAATDSSIYDAADQAMATTLVAVTGDATAPALTDQSPAHSATDIAIDSNLTFALSDSGAGVDWTSFQVQLSGDKGYSKTYTDMDTSVVSKTGSMVSYDVTVNPDVNFSNGEIITVTVHVSDYVGNAIVPPAWSFTTQAASTPQTMTIHPSGLASEGSGNFAPTGGDWNSVLDSNDGDLTYVSVCCQGFGTFYADMDDPGIGAATINSVTVKVVVRNSVAGNVNIGYKTGTGVIWKGNTSVGTNYTTLTLNAPTNSDGGAWTLADLNNLKVAVWRNYTGSPRCYVTEVAVDINYTP
jgi:predicted CxxxxCH...CXXCH cytochrome family protein